VLDHHLGLEIALVAARSLRIISFDSRTVVVCWQFKHNEPTVDPAEIEIAPSLSCSLVRRWPHLSHS